MTRYCRCTPEGVQAAAAGSRVPSTVFHPVPRCYSGQP